MIKINTQKLKQEINKIKLRNSKVETDKAWGTSYFRKILIAVLTYFVIVLFLIVLDLPNPYTNAVVPALGVFLPTLVVPVFKKFWIKGFYQKKSR